LTNLVTNAVAAMETGGTLTVQTSDADGAGRGAVRVSRVFLVVKPVSTGTGPVGTQTVPFQSERRMARFPFGARRRNR